MGISSFIDLCKPKIVLLLTITALVGMLLTVEFYSNVLSSLASLLGFALLAASSAALNQIFDRESDKNMERTKGRPLASGNISLYQALTFTALLLFIGSSLLLYFSNLMTLLITTFGFIFYSLVYTIYLKWSTPQNIVIGGLSGALPPLIGWTAVTNEISLLPLILVLIIFLWTPPHFWPLAIDRIDEYRKEGVPMMPIAKGADAHVPWGRRTTDWWRSISCLGSLAPQPQEQLISLSRGRQSRGRPFSSVALVLI